MEIFLISIGYYLPNYNYKYPVSINLHQQTPNDFTIGDLFGGLAGKFFIIEFKSDEKNLRSELRKPERDRLIHKLENNDSEELIRTSLNSHFICYPRFENVEMQLNLNPYLAVVIGKLEERIILGVKGGRIYSKESIGANFKEIENYISLLQSCAEEVGKKSFTGESSGIMMNFGKKGIR